ncbi:MAG: hypothetical protein K2K60_02275 [Clostridia bacterium]|nr:hypothetical protein [Clostridia bacterium]
MFKNAKNAAFIIAVISAVAVTAVICIFVIANGGGKLTYKADYYYICYRIADNSVSASSLSETASSYGGAGYVITHDGNYYATVSCYYSENDADGVCSSLKRRGLDCSVLKISTDKFKLKTRSARKNAELYAGNLNTLNSLSLLAYECANALDLGNYNQSKAKDVASALKSGLNGLLRANENNCFTDRLENLVDICDDKCDGYIYSKDMRYIQIAVTDVIINAEIY